MDRLGILGMPTFQRVVAENRVSRAPMGEQAPFYIFTAYVFAYGVGVPKVSSNIGRLTAG